MGVGRAYPPPSEWSVVRLYFIRGQGAAETAPSAPIERDVHRLCERCLARRQRDGRLDGHLRWLPSSLPDSTCDAGRRGARSAGGDGRRDGLGPGLGRWRRGRTGGRSRSVRDLFTTWKCRRGSRVRPRLAAPGTWPRPAQRYRARAADSRTCALASIPGRREVRME